MRIAHIITAKMIQRRQPITSIVEALGRKCWIIVLSAIAGVFIMTVAGIFNGASAHAADTSGIHADSVAHPGPSPIEKDLESRGLLGLHSTSGPAAFVPPPGVEVDETVQRAKGGTSVISRSKSWSEKLADNTLRVELTNFPSGQYQVQFWLLPSNSQGCKLFGRTMYDTHGRPTESEFWRNGQGLKITGSANFPSDLYPKQIPAVAVPRALGDMMRSGGQAVINQQVTPYGYVDLHLHVSDAPPVQTPAGKFEAVKIESQPDLATLLPGWPHFVFHIVAPFIPRTTYYFEAHAPYRLLRKEQEGTPLIGGPEANTELVRYYTEGASASAAPGNSVIAMRSPQ
jgi:hypothetical protein